MSRIKIAENVNKTLLNVKSLLPIVFEEVCRERFNNGDPGYDSRIAHSIRKANEKEDNSACRKVFVIDTDQFTSFRKTTELYTLYMVASLTVCQILLKTALDTPHLRDLHKQFEKEEHLLRYKYVFLRPFVHMGYHCTRVLDRAPQTFLNLFLANRFHEEEFEDRETPLLLHDEPLSAAVEDFVNKVAEKLCV